MPRHFPGTQASVKTDWLQEEALQSAVGQVQDFTGRLLLYSTNINVLHEEALRAVLSCLAAVPPPSSAALGNTPWLQEHSLRGGKVQRWVQMGSWGGGAEGTGIFLFKEILRRCRRWKMLTGPLLPETAA